MSAMPSTSAREEPLVDAEIPLVFRIGAVLSLVVMLLSVVIVVLAGLNAGEYLTFPPRGLSLRWVITFLTSQSLRTSYLLSLTIAFVVMLLSTTLGTMAALVRQGPAAAVRPDRAFDLARVLYQSGPCRTGALLQRSGPRVRRCLSRLKAVQCWRRSVSSTRRLQYGASPHLR
jgi:hypothetical protein